MNKRIILIRHATAENGSTSPMFKDIDRELISKGFRESAKMGFYLKDHLDRNCYIFTSPAKRTLRTAELLAEQINIPLEQLVEVEDLYGGGPRAYLSTLTSLKESVDIAVIVGHNPDISFFAEYLTRDEMGGSLEKCTAVCLMVEKSTAWSELSANSMDFSWRKSISDIHD